MKRVLFEDMYCWSVFNEVRQIDFNGHLWVRKEGNVLIDPVPMIDSDLEQLDRLGGAALIVITNRDHEREAAFFQGRTGAQVVAHEADAPLLEVRVGRRVGDGEEVVPGLAAVHLRHGKSPGEMALYWPEKRLVLSGDLLVGAPVGRFSLLMDEKLEDPPRAALELRKLLDLEFDAVLVGDGHSILQNAREQVIRCLEDRRDIYINRLNIDEVAWEQGQGPDGYRWQQKDLDPLVGARHLGYRLIRLPAGQSTYPLHFHHFEEELFYLMEGRCTLLSPRGEWEVRAGDFIACPPGLAGTHKFRNDGADPCVLLALSNRLPHDVFEYPDSGKVGCRSLPRSHRYFRKEDTVDYWEGEVREG